MPSPIYAMITSAVKCVTCGASYGKCDCAERAKAEAINREYNELMKLSDQELIAECKRLGVKI